MYNWVTVRKIPRTEGPNYPARAVQTVDAVVAKWIPVTAALLACFVTPTRSKLDSRYYESPNYPVRAVQTVDATVRTWIPTGDQELASFSTPARRPLDARRYDWSPEFISIPRLIDPTIAQWQPADTTELASFSTRARAPLDVRRYEWAPEFVDLVNRVDGQVRTWMPAADAELASFRTPARPSLDVRSYEWSVDESAWISRAITVTDDQLWPAITTEAQTIPPKRPDARDRFDTAPGVAWIQTAIDPTTASWCGAFNAVSVRTGDRARLDVRSYDWAANPPSVVALSTNGGGGGLCANIGSGFVVRRVIARTTGPQDLSWFYSLPAAAGPTVAQTAPAWTNATRNAERTPARRLLDVRTYDWIQPFGVEDDPAWRDALLYDFNRSYRTPARAKLDVRQYEWSQPAWIYTNIPAGQVPPTQAQIWPAILQASGLSYRSTARAPLDVRAFDWMPAFGWLPPVVDGVVGRWAGIWNEETNAFRTGDRARLDVRRHEWQPAFSWVSRTLDSLFAPYVPVYAAELASFRTGQRAPLDVRTYDWAPEFDWVQRAADAVIAKWQPIFAAEVSYRTPDGQRLNVRELTSAPQPAWWAAAVAFLRPFPDVIVIMRADVGIVEVGADVQIVLVREDTGTVEL